MKQFAFAPSVARFARKPAVLGTLGILMILLVYLFMRGSNAANADDREAAAIARTADTVVTLDATSEKLAGIELLTVGSAGGSSLIVNGAITYDANRVSVIASRVDGRLVNVRADLGQQIPAGGLLALLESAEVGQTRGELDRARANVDIARRNYEREERLFREQISPQKELLEAEAAYRSAQADLASAAAKLRAMGAVGGEGAMFELRSPISGIVVERNASPGATVGPAINLFTVADLRSVWITVDVYEKDLPRIHQGATATVMPTALTGESFLGRVTYAGGVVDPASHTFKVRVEVGNSNLRLRPGMFAQVRIDTPATPSSALITVPEAAVQDLNGKSVVFVLTGPRKYTARTIVVGSRTGDGRLTISNGLSTGEQIAVNGAFQLKAELLKSTFGESD